MAGLAIGDWLNEATEQLSVAGVDEPRLDAELLLCHRLGLTRATLLAHPDRLLSPMETRALAALLARRAGREPLPYILGTREFFGLRLAVDSRVLIPRPETELLVERALWLASRISSSGPLRIADVGTGSGCIAVALAVHLPHALIYATDVSADAMHGVASRIRFLWGDLLSPVPQSVHLIVANLPYIAAQEWEMLPPEVGRFEPRCALDGGPDGLDLVRRLLMQAPAYLLPGGALLLEIGARQGEAVMNLARAAFHREGMPIPSSQRGEGRGEGQVHFTSKLSMEAPTPGHQTSVVLFADLAGHARIVQVCT